MGVLLRGDAHRDRAGAIVSTYRVGTHHGIVICAENDSYLCN